MKVKVVNTCPFCKRESAVIVEAYEWNSWAHGTPVQEAFPDVSPAEREQSSASMRCC